ncbi:MAG: hypothetical protein FJ288_15560 [Planctomycetes bacterium]|nr:hypothetical protein [Planctomycetota bacterium]
MRTPRCGTAVFLDTTIQIARLVHSRQMKDLIAQRLAQYDVRVTSSVVKQEFKRRLLRDAAYLLQTLARVGSYQGVMRHVSDVLPPKQNRKRNICIQVLETVDESDTDEDRTDRLKLYLRSLLTDGINQFEDMVDSVLPGCGCACANAPIREVRKYERYEFGTDKCSRAKGECGVIEFLRQNEARLRNIVGVVRGLSPKDKSIELRQAEEFIESVLADAQCARRLNPCSLVGDLLIALESAGIPVFYTMNRAESQYLCRALGQELVVRPRNPEKADEE